MTSSSAPTPVGESPLIQELNSDRRCTTPELYMRPMPSPPLESESAPPELPAVMADLQHAGHHFQTVSCELWKVNGPKVRIKKDCSVCFSVDTVVTSQNIVVGFDRLGIDIDSITSIQRKASNNTWVVTFDSPVSKDAALNEQSVTISGCVVFLGDRENKVSIVKLYKLPTELPDSVIIDRLSHYGRVFSFRRDRIAKGIYSGVHTTRMIIDRPNRNSGPNVYCRRIRPYLLPWPAQNLPQMPCRRAPCRLVQITALL